MCCKHASRNQLKPFAIQTATPTARTANAIAKAGNRRAVTTTWGHNGQEADRFQLRRYDMVAERVRDSRGTLVPALVAFRMSGFYPGLG